MVHTFVTTDRTAAHRRAGSIRALQRVLQHRQGQLLVRELRVEELQRKVVAVDAVLGRGGRIVLVAAGAQLGGIGGEVEGRSDLQALERIPVDELEEGVGLEGAHAADAKHGALCTAQTFVPAAEETRGWGNNKKQNNK